MRACWLVSLACLSLSCAQRSDPPILAPTLDWITAFSEAHRAAEDRNFNDADAILADFMKLRRGTPEAREAAYWRAVYLLDPSNRTSNPRQAALYLDEYIVDQPPPANISQARALRGMAATVDSLDAAIRAAQERAAKEVEETSKPAPDTGREAELEKEIEKLKEHLDKANAELDRIKKRLTAPRPPG